MSNVKFLQGTDLKALPTYSTNTVGQVYFYTDTSNSDSNYWDGRIIFDSPKGRITMSTQALLAEKDINYKDLIEYLCDAEVVYDSNKNPTELIFTRGNGSTLSFAIPKAVRDVTEGSANGTVKVNINGTTKDVKVHGLGDRAYDSTAYLPLHGNADTATGFKNAKTITLQGDVQGSGSGGNGSLGWTIDTTIPNGSIENAQLKYSSMNIAGNTVSLGGTLAADKLRTSLGLSNAMHFIGIATVAITDGSTTDPEISNYTTKTAGDVIIDKDSAYEYVWTGSKWERLGPDGSYKTIQSAVVSPSANGTEIAFIDTISQNANGQITATKKTVRDASTSQSGVVSTGAQSFAGIKTFAAQPVMSAGLLSNNTITIKRSTSASGAATSTNPIIRFDNVDSSQYAALVFSDYDSYQAPSSITLSGNQGGEYFIAPNIKATTRFYGNLTGNVTGNLTGTATNATSATTASKLGTATVGGTTVPIYLNAGVATKCTTYAGGTNVTLNGSGKSGSTASFYAPTSAGTSGYGLMSQGSGEPVWKPLSFTFGKTKVVSQDFITTSTYQTKYQLSTSNYKSSAIYNVYVNGFEIPRSQWSISSTGLITLTNGPELKNTPVEIVGIYIDEVENPLKRESELITTTVVNQTIFKLDYYRDNAIYDVYINGMRVPDSEFGINTASGTIVLAEGPDINQPVEIVKTYLSDIAYKWTDYNQDGEQVVFIRQATAPSNINAIWVDTSEGVVKIWNGSIWEGMNVYQ